MIFRHAVCGLSIGFAVLVARGADATIEFSGVLTANGKTKVALTDPATKDTQWVETGEDFKGYSVGRYDAKEEAVFVKKGGREIRLPLVASKITTGASSALPVAGTAAATTPTNPAATAAANAVRANLRQLAMLARQYQQQRGVTSVSVSDLVGPDKVIKELTPIAGENYSSVTFGPNVSSVSVTMADGNVVSLDLPPATATSMVANASATTPVAPTPAATATVPNSASVPPEVTAAPPTTTAVAAGSAGLPTPGTGTGNSQPALTPTGREYQVQQGDTWQKISEATGVSLPDLRRLNPGSNGGSPPPGQPIRIQ
jgi:LysM repeat protein